jgi:hypothetical protein
MQINFGGFNNVDNDEFMKTCSSYEGCEGCPMVGGKVVNTSSGQMRCETGVSKSAKQ